MDKKYWLINVHGKHGYSIMIHGEIDDDCDAIEAASKANLFTDEKDADYATAEEPSEYDIEYFEKYFTVNEIN